MPQLRSIFFSAALLVYLAGCRHTVQEKLQPSVTLPNAYSLAAADKASALPSKWWQVLDDKLLAQYIQEALSDSFTLKEGLARLKQARLTAKQADADLYPAITAGGRIDTDLEDGEADLTGRIGINLYWEADLWGRLNAASKAAALDADTAEEALQDLTLHLSIALADTYYRLIEQNLYQNLLQRQITADETALDLIKLRFGNGAASLADVYQQKELLASIKAQLPQSKAEIIVLGNRLRVLLGRMPDSSELAMTDILPEPPPLPSLGIPADLLLNRPDLRRLHREVAAADYRVAEATAERLPALKLGASVGLSSGDFLLSIFAEALATIIDQGHKKNEVEKQKARVEEKMAAWSQAYLEAVEEVENALHQEAQQVLHLTALQDQLELARSALKETRNRYLYGATDYLPMLSALDSVQKLERTILRQQRERLSLRLLLYSALGGGLPETAKHPSSEKTP